MHEVKTTHILKKRICAKVLLAKNFNFHSLTQPCPTHLCGSLSKGDDPVVVKVRVRCVLDELRLRELVLQVHLVLAEYVLQTQPLSLLHEL